MTMTANEDGSEANRVPDVTLDFWLIKIMAVTMGETAADYLAVTLGLGLTVTSLIMSGILIVALVLEFAQKRYVPWAYWLAVVLSSVVGTLVTDNLVDNFGVRLETTTIIFSVALALTFIAWYASGKTLSIHTIFTTRREIFYWLAVLFTFSLGTVAGDLVAERFDMGYLATGLILGGLIAAIALAWLFLGLNGILAFWLAYILTRPFGASFGDLLAQPVEYGGMGFGTTFTSLTFLGSIVVIVLYMTLKSLIDEDEQALLD
ncbi:MAG: hypothetical protein EOQ50_31740 [Mesorhizobium sp.]|uniref:COG4705 family protein n=1 Tax=Mesorhizobium sp. TaxID=1871066 RepID=UPI000FE578B0|nr:hypothetical protein [Mesorhizobium sp.]RWB66883.1 MAG: hypothetical protein EOQ50_31740 [Mesorhizobium sp.]